MPYSSARARVCHELRGWPRARTAIYPRINIYMCTHTRRRRTHIHVRVSFIVVKKKKRVSFRAASRGMSFFFFKRPFILIHDYKDKFDLAVSCITRGRACQIILAIKKLFN